MMDPRSFDDIEGDCVAAIRELAVPRPAADLLHLPGSLANRPVLNKMGSETHVPAHPELLCPLRRGTRVVSPQRTTRVARGQLLLIDPGVEHGAVNDEGSDILYLDVHASNVHFCRDSDPQGLVSLYLVGRTDLTFVCEIIGQELSEREMEHERSVYGLLEHLASILIRRVERGTYLRLARGHSPAGLELRPWEAIKAALGYLAAHLGEPIDLEALAGKTGYSLGHLNRYFLRFYGKTVSRCLRDLRMAHAQHLLRSSNMPVNAIADRVGYSDPSNFRRAFVNATGETLRKCRSGSRRLSHGDLPHAL